MGYTTIRQAIVNQLTTTGLFNEVFDYEPGTLQKWPCASVEPQNSVNSFANLAQNKRTYFFTIRCYEKIEDGNQGAADALLMGIADSVVQAFEQNIRLSGACDRCRPLSGKWDRVDKGSGPVNRLFEITLEVIENVQVR